MQEIRGSMLPAVPLIGGGRPAVPTVEWSSLKLEHFSTLPGHLVEYRPTSNMVVLATGTKRTIQVVSANAPPRHLEVSPGQVHILPANVPVAFRLFRSEER